MKKFENLGRSINKEEQRNITGGFIEPSDGGTCYWHTAGWTQYDCGMSATDAQAVATAYALLSGEHGYWCCASC